MHLIFDGFRLQTPGGGALLAGGEPLGSAGTASSGTETVEQHPVTAAGTHSTLMSPDTLTSRFDAEVTVNATFVWEQARGRFCFWVTWGRISVSVFIHRGPTTEADKFPLARLSGLLDIKGHFSLCTCLLFAPFTGGRRHRRQPDNLESALCFFLINRSSHGSLKCKINCV